MLRLATRAPGLGEGVAVRRVYRLGGAVPNQLTEARHRVVEALRAFGGAPMTLAELAAEAGCGTSVVKGLVKLGVVVEEDAPRDLPFATLDPAGAATLAGDQVAAASWASRASTAGNKTLFSLCTWRWRSASNSARPASSAAATAPRRSAVAGGDGHGMRHERATGSAMLRRIQKIRTRARGT